MESVREALDLLKMDSVATSDLKTSELETVLIALAHPNATCHIHHKKVHNSSRLTFRLFDYNCNVLLRMGNGVEPKMRKYNPSRRRSLTHLCTRGN